jgi:signal transduction histidine kinase/DNA-binding response OmpR family regulator
MVDEEKVDILVVDDLPEKLFVLGTVLEGLGQNIVTAHSGREALRRLLEREFAVILLDVHMPDMDGFETAAMIRARRQTEHTPIIFITAFGDEMHTAQGYSLGAVDYILSPVVPEILRAKVGVFVDLYKKTRQVKRQAEERVALAREQAARAAAEEATRRSAFLAEASTVLFGSLDYEAIPRGLARQAIPLLGDVCAVTIDGGRVRRTELAWVDLERGAQAATSAADDPLMAILAGRVARVLATGEPQLIQDLAAPAAGSADDAGSAAEINASHATGPGFAPRSAIVVPLQARGRILGTIALARRDPHQPYQQEHLALAEDLADRAAIAIDTARLYRDIHENDQRKNEFLAMLAHELRNPLAPIRNAVYILRKLGLNDTKLQWANDIIARQVEQMVRLVDDLLDISRITEGKIQLRREPVDVGSIVDRAVEISRPLIDARKHTLTVAVPEEPLTVDADKVRLAQVLANLLNNAAKYTGEGGTIAVEVSRVADEAIFRVRDNGIGISPEMLSSVFDLFTQADRSLDRSQGGLGIGLTLARRLIEMHGGRVEAYSEGANRGSEFIIRMAVLPETLRTSAPAVVTTTNDRSARRCVLLVDDQADVVRSLAQLLRLGGHEVRSALNGPEALSELVSYRPDVILLDIGLPGMDGYEIARSIRQQPGMETVYLVALTGYGQDEDKRRSQEAGFNQHFVKPVDPDALLALLSEGQFRAGVPAGVSGLLTGT